MGVKGGVSNLHAVGNFFHDSYHCIETSGPRQQSRSSGSGQGPIHPGGKWRVQQNIFQSCDTGVVLTSNYTGQDYFPNDVINNLFIDDHDGVSIPQVGGAHQIANNIFLGGPTTNSSSGTPGGALLFDSPQNPPAATYADAFFAEGVRSSHNLFFQMDHPFIEHYNNSAASYRVETLDQFRQLYSSAEVGSMDTDPMLDKANGYTPLPGSPVIGAGDGSFYGKASVNIGLYPLAPAP